MPREPLSAGCAESISPSRRGSGQAEDGLGNVGGIVCLQEVLARQQHWVIQPCGQLRLDTVVTPRQSAIADTPNDLERIGQVAHRRQVTMLLVCGQLEASHDLQNGAAPSSPSSNGT
jgi:hypothetical protein